MISGIKYSFLIISLFCLPTLLISQNNIQAELLRILKTPDMKYASVGVSVIDLDTGKELFSHDADRALSPASSMKVITTATGLMILGENFRFRTEIQYDGNISEDGILNGNIYIKGFGDPSLGAGKPEGTLGYEEVNKLFVRKIKEKGIKKISGKIIGDESYYQSPTLPASWQWEDLGNYYGAGVNALNINANTYFLDFQQRTNPGARPKVMNIEPYLPNIHIINEVRTAARGTGDNCYIFGSPYTNTRFLRGTIPAGNGRFTVKGSLPDPAFTAAMLLLKTLEQEGISTLKIASTSRLEGEGEGERKVIYSHSSSPLINIIRTTNEDSNNLYCEAILKAIAKKQKDDSSTSKGIEAIEDFWKGKGLSLEGFFMNDGSGLSAKNALTSSHFTKILTLIHKDKEAYSLFRNTLPVSGKTGTMKYMFRGTSAEGKIFAKTGSMTRIRSYTGYMDSAKGKKLAFSIIVNNYEGESSAMREKLKKLMFAIYQS